MDNEIIKLGFADDHAIFREGLCVLLKTIENINVVIEASNGKELIEELEHKTCDILLLDIKMPFLNGIEAVKIITKKFPKTKIIALTGYYDDENINEIYHSDVKGICLKHECKRNDLIEALQRVMEGETYYSKNVYSILANVQKDEEIIKSFTILDLKILDLVAKGFNNLKIGLKLFITPKAIAYHKTKLLEITESKNIAQLAVFAIKHKLIKLE